MLLAAAAAGKAEARTAVVIGQVPVSMPQEVENDAGNDALDTFRVHDLSRRWIEHRMRSDFLEPTLQPLAPAPSVAVDPPAVVIPGWMRPAPELASWNAPATCYAAAYRPSGLLDFEGEARRRSIYDQVHATACRQGIPVELFDALIIQESQYDSSAVSPKQAYGYTQLMPGTAQGLGVNRFDPLDNLRGGARYLRSQLDRFGKIELALSAYNAGPGRVVDRVPAIAQTRDYVSRVMRNLQVLGGGRTAALVAPGFENVSSSTDPGPRGRSAVLLSF
ncbi:lytic transglycosylase domain-containing protein [Sphingobium sp. AS12]|uniref:lytic transglycosylase domain-containing protein n=1 Tax=Sphingobium sp. AS12 TaxID=2849495 RepID=UPI0020C8C213|nr:lytic transglycosylase domain-containing protein [Sphingobium sp. AS12]